MTKKALIYGVAGLVTSGAIAGLLIVNSTQAQSSPKEQDPHHPSAQTNPRHGGMMADMDRHFIEMMIPHHEDAVVMADLALTRAKRPEIKQLAATIKKDQNREIKQMRDWYKQWYNTEVPATSMDGMGMPGMGMQHGMMDMEMDLEALKNASDFDAEFIRQMIPHHRMAVMMSRMALNRANRPEIRNLAQSIINSQTAEIRQMGQWYQAWYR